LVESEAVGEADATGVSNQPLAGEYPNGSSLRMNRTGRRWNKTALLIALHVFLWLIILEWCVSAFAPAPTFELLRVSDGAKSQYEMSLNKTLIYVPKPGTGEFNSGGYRGKVVPVRRQAGKTRILIMGRKTEFFDYAVSAKQSLWAA
jgi:hypothetical protein